MSKFDAALMFFDMLEEPAMLELDRSTRYLYVEAYTWSAKHRTDGGISRAALRRLTDIPDPGMAAAQLVSAGLWELAATGWLIVDYLKRQMGKADIERAENKLQAKWRRQDHHQRGDHSLCDPKYCTSAGRSRRAEPPGLVSSRLVVSNETKTETQASLSPPALCSECGKAPAVAEWQQRPVCQDCHVSLSSRIFEEGREQLAQTLAAKGRP